LGCVTREGCDVPSNSVATGCGIAGTCKQRYRLYRVPIGGEVLSVFGISTPLAAGVRRKY
jgi:hypothetical protein